MIRTEASGDSKKFDVAEMLRVSVPTYAHLMHFRIRGQIPTYVKGPYSHLCTSWTIEVKTPHLPWYTSLSQCLWTWLMWMWNCGSWWVSCLGRVQIVLNDHVSKTKIHSLNRACHWRTFHFPSHTDNVKLQKQSHPGTWRFIWWEFLERHA